MKKLLPILLFVQFIFAAEFAKTLPAESKQLIDSFDCFSKDDKKLLTAYLLALEYRIDHVDKREALVKTELDYWRLWHIVSDIEEQCKLYYKFDDIMEETLVQSAEVRKRLKKLRRVEGSIHVDGASESSARMDKYDAGLRKIILLDPPKYRLLPKNADMPDYNLTVLKKYPPNTIPKNIFDQIEHMKATPLQKDMLRREAYLREEMLRNYDKPEKRKTMKQEMLYLEACQKQENLYANGEFYHNFKRKLAHRVVTSQYYGLKHEFLPKEIESYCENNITKMHLDPFVPKVEKKKKTKEGKKLQVKLANLSAFLKRYEKDPKKKKYAERYLSLMKSQLQKRSAPTPNLAALKLLRLEECLVHGNEKEAFALIMSRVKDFRIEGIKETFYSNIFNAQMWWKMTIKMKMDAEGATHELKHFFDCNQTLLMPGKSMHKQHSMKPASRFSTMDLHNAISQKDEILKYYAKVFENIPTPNLNNQRAVAEGIVAKKWIDVNGTIKAPMGERVLISGMPKGGIKLTYTGIPKGKLCTDFIQLNKNDVIFFNNKSYDGIDYIMVNNDKLKLDHYIYKQAQRVCNRQKKNTISFVRESMIVKHKYRQTSLDSAFGHVDAVNTIDVLRYNPDSAAYIQGKNNFAISGNSAKLYDAKLQTVVQKLPGKLVSSFHTALSPDGRYMAVGRYGSTIYIWDMQQSRIIKTIKKKIGGVKLFLPDNKTLVTVDKVIHFIDIESGEITATLKPQFMPVSQKYNFTSISVLTVSPDGKMLYIGSNKGNIERWEINRSLFGSDVTVSYADSVKDSGIRKVGALAFDRDNQNILIIASQNRKVDFMDIKTGKVVKTYDADVYMGAKYVAISKDHKYMLVTGDHGAFLWKLDQTEQYDIINGDKIVGGMFLDDPDKFILMAREVKVWQIN